VVKKKLKFIYLLFSIKEWPDLEIWVWGRSTSRLLKMGWFDRPCMTFY